MKMNVNEKRKELSRALSENEFSADFHIFVTETLEDAEALGEELALRRGEIATETVAENAVDALSEAVEDFETAEENDKTEE